LAHGCNCSYGWSCACLLHAYGVKFVAEFLAKQQIKKQFGTYLSPAMVEKLQKNPELLTLGGESRELSIMFTDVRGFTTISEHYGADVQGPDPYYESIHDSHDCQDHRE
jgi:hypothetical protein